MPDNLIEFTPSAYQYPLLLKHLLHYPMVHSPNQEIVYRDLRRHSYRVFRERMGGSRAACHKSALGQATSLLFSIGTAIAISSAISPCR